MYYNYYYCSPWIDDLLHGAIPSLEKEVFDDTQDGPTINNTSYARSLVSGIFFKFYMSISRELARKGVRSIYVTSLILYTRNLYNELWCLQTTTNACGFKMVET